MKRTYNQRRANDQRHINRRIRLLKDTHVDTVIAWDANRKKPIHAEQQRNRLRKHNLTCDCSACKQLTSSLRSEYNKRITSKVDSEYDDWYNDDEALGYLL